MHDDLILRIVRAALRLAAVRMRGEPRPEPEVYPPALDEALMDEGLPKSAAAEVDNVARLLVVFGDSVRAAERKDRPLVAMLGEKLPPKKRPKGSRA